MQYQVRFLTAVIVFAACWTGTAVSTATAREQAGTLVSAAPAENPEIAEGVAAALQGDQAAATEHFAEAQKKRPGSRPGGIDAAVAFTDPSFEFQHFDKLRFWLEKTAEDYPNDPEAFLILADLAFAEDRFLECSMLTEHALKLVEAFDGDATRRRSLRIYVEKLRASVAERKHRWDDAARFLKRLAELEPENGEHPQQLGLVLFRLGRKDEALKSLEHAEKIDPALLPASILLAHLAEREGRGKEAEDFMAEALLKRGDDPRVLLAAAELELRRRRLDRVRTLAEQAQKLDPDSVEAAMRLGIVNLYDGRFEEAEERFMKLVERMPNHAEAMTGLALALCEQDDARQRRRAYSVAKRNADTHPKSLDAATTLAWVLIRNGALDEAEKILMRQFDAGEMNAPGAYYLAVVFSQRNREDEAVIFLKNALKTNSNFPKRVAAETLLKSLTEKTE